MPKKEEKPTAKIIIGFALVIAVVSFLTMNSKQSAQVETQTDIEVRAFVGIPAENKLGGIEFAVLNRYGYHKVIFYVRGFNKGLKLHSVSGYRDGREVDYFNQTELVELVWDKWLGRYQQEVLTEATTGEKLNTSNTPSSK